MSNDKLRDELLQFLDEHAFDPVLSAPLERADRREALEDAQTRADWLKRQYHERCRTAGDVRAQFVADVLDASAVRLDRELDRLGLPTLPRLRAMFLSLCERLGVGAPEHAAAG